MNKTQKEERIAPVTPTPRQEQLQGRGNHSRNRLREKKGHVLTKVDHVQLTVSSAASSAKKRKIQDNRLEGKPKPLALLREKKSHSWRGHKMGKNLIVRDGGGKKRGESRISYGMGGTEINAPLKRDAIKPKEVCLKRGPSKRAEGGSEQDR